MALTKVTSHFITGTITNDTSGNAATVTNGIYTNESHSNPSWITGLAWSKITGAPAFITGITSSNVTTALGFTPVTNARQITINGTSFDLSADRSWTITSMIYPSAGIPISTGSGWGSSITNNSSNWNTAYGWGNHASGGYASGSVFTTFGTYGWQINDYDGATADKGRIYYDNGDRAFRFYSEHSGSTGAANIQLYDGSAYGELTKAKIDKLDGIAASATNVTNTNQLTNGAGFITSADGGNATTLDGIDSSQFQRNDTGTLPLARMNTVLPTSGNYVWNNATTAGNYNIGLQTAFVASAQGFPEYGSVLHVGARGGTDAGGDFQIFCGHGSANGGNQLRVRNADNSATPSDAWTSWRIILDSANYGSYSTFSGDITWGNGYKLSNGNNSNNAEILSATTGSSGIVLKDSAGTFKMQLYGEGGYYGLLASEWGNWDLRKQANGELTIYVSGTGRTAIHTGNYSSYALPLAGGTMTGQIAGYVNASGDGQGNLPFKLSADYNSYMVAVASNTWGLFWAGNAGARYGTNGNGGPGNIWSNSTNPNEMCFVHSDSTTWSVHTDGNTWQSGRITASGVTMSGPLRRLAHNTGHLEGSYNNVGANSTKSNPIYTIGSNYNPADSSLSNMYGIGFAHPNLSGWGSGKTSDWGMYVVEAGTINCTLGGGSITAWFANQIKTQTNLILSGSDSHIMGGSITSRAALRAIDVGYAGTSCYISASRTSSNISMIMIGGTSNQNYIFNRASATDTSGRTMIVTRGNTNAFLMNGGSGYVTFYGGHGNSSDRLLKKNIEDSNYGLEAVNNLKPRRFFWKDETVSKQKQIGFIAQGVEEVLPESVRGYEGDKSIIDNSLISVLTKAIQELSQEVTALKAEVESLKE